jgi:hypothetical protein
MVIDKPVLLFRSFLRLLKDLPSSGALAVLFHGAAALFCLLKFMKTENVYGEAPAMLLYAEKKKGALFARTL